MFQYYKENADKIYYENIEFNEAVNMGCLGDGVITRSKVKRGINLMSHSMERKHL